MKNPQEVYKWLAEQLYSENGLTLTYLSIQSTKCAVCGAFKYTPLRRDEMGGYVCLTCIDKRLDRAIRIGAALSECRTLLAGHFPKDAATFDYLTGLIERIDASQAVGGAL